MQSLQSLRIIHLPKTLAITLATVSLLIGVANCRGGDQATNPATDDGQETEEIESSLTFNNITLKQAAEDGSTLWNVQAERVVYSQDQKVAEVTNPRGELFEDGKAIMQVQAQQGEIQQDGEKILLRGQVIATDLKSKAVLRGDEMEWVPSEGILTVRNRVVGTHPQLRMSARQIQFFSKERRVELTGRVVAISKDPALRLQGEKLNWLIDQEKVMSDRFVQVARMNGDRITDTAAANQADVNLKTKIATLRQNAQIALSNPPLQIAGNSLIWNVQQDTLVANQPVTVNQQQQQVVINANQARMDLKRRIANFTQNVRAVSQRNQSRLNADRLTWNIPTQQVQAEGNVDYQQVNPFLHVRGPRAVGRLDNQTVVVSGGRVVSEIIPE
jgi:LPS export ABC transporter protein LptC